MEIKEPHIHGSVNFKSDLSIEEVGAIISTKVFSGVQFGGKENNIYEEVPAIYIDNLMLGFLFVIQGYSGIDNKFGFTLSITPVFSIGSNKDINISEYIDVNLDYYLYSLLEDRLKNIYDIKVIKPEKL